MVDTGPLYAALAPGDPNHAAVTAWLRGVREPLVVPVGVVVETAQLVEARLRPAALAGFLRDMADDGSTIVCPGQRELERAADLVTDYASLRLGLVDATVVALAERLGVTTIATLDRRHFTVVRPLHVESFDLVP